MVGSVAAAVDGGSLVLHATRARHCCKTLFPQSARPMPAASRPLATTRTHPAGRPGINRRVKAHPADGDPGEPGTGIARPSSMSIISIISIFPAIATVSESRAREGSDRDRRI